MAHASGNVATPDPQRSRKASIGGNMRTATSGSPSAAGSGWGIQSNEDDAYDFDASGSGRCSTAPQHERMALHGTVSLFASELSGKN